MIARFLLTLLVRALACAGRPFVPVVSTIGKYLWLLSVFATIPEEERDWFSAFLVLHSYARYGQEGEHTNRQMEKAYHRMHWGRWEETA